MCTVWTPLQSVWTYQEFHLSWRKSAVSHLMAPLWSSQCNSSYLSNWSTTRPHQDALSGNAICYRLGSFVEMLWSRQIFWNRWIFMLPVWRRDTPISVDAACVCVCDKEEIWQGTETEGDAHRQLITGLPQSRGTHQKINAFSQCHWSKWERDAG